MNHTDDVNPIALIPIGLVTPVAMASIVLVPSYAGFYYATKLIYAANNVDLSPYALHVFYIIETYFKLFSYWLDHYQTADILSYSLPLITLPLIGIGISIIGAIIFVGYIMALFQKMD